MDDLTATCSYFAPMRQNVISVSGLPERNLFQVARVLQVMPQMTSVTVESSNLHIVANSDNLVRVMRDIQAAIKLTYRNGDVCIKFNDDHNTDYVLRPDGNAHRSHDLYSWLERREYDRWLNEHGFFNANILVTDLGLQQWLLELVDFKHIGSDTNRLNRAIAKRCDIRGPWTMQHDKRVTMNCSTNDMHRWLQWTHQGLSELAGSTPVVLRSERGFDRPNVRIIVPDGSVRNYYGPKTGDITKFLRSFMPATATK